MKRLIPLLALVLCVSCKTPCANETVLTGGLANGIATALSCTNVAQIQIDVVNTLAAANICTASEPVHTLGGPIALVVCPLVAQAAVSVLGAKVPVTWSCNPVLAEQGVATVVTAACNLLPF